ncbi:MAG: hypothetical protein M1817_004578 [Caeruleum heppii]|nr:MAG: hypothetical protein M1817_004578 [Caeruleum heppii]
MSLPKHIPTPSEIRSDGVLLSHPSRETVKVVKMSSQIAVKYGVDVSLSEGTTMQFVAAHCSSCPPTVWAMFSDPITIDGVQMTENFIVMDFIPGMTLEAAWSSLTADERLTIGNQVKVLLEGLRSTRLPDPAYLGGVYNGRYNDGIFWTVPEDPAICGPFPNEGAFNEGMLRRLGGLTDSAHLRLLRGLFDQLFSGHRTVFTHGDLQAKNIMVEPLQSVAQDETQRRFKITLIDWELSGWYPEYWEQQIMSYRVYSAEYLGNPNHVRIWVESDAQNRRGDIYHVVGNILNGMTFEHKIGRVPEDSASFVSGTKVYQGSISAHELRELERVCRSVPAPGKQLALNGRPLNPRVPLRRCGEWVTDALEALRRRGVLHNP